MVYSIKGDIMKGFAIALFLILTSINSYAAGITAMTTHGKEVEVSTLSEAASNPVYAGSTITVRAALSSSFSNISSATVHAWPGDRALKVEKGGSIANTTKFSISEIIAAKLSQIFTGTGAVTGLKKVYVGQFGVVADDSTDNTATLSKALAAVADYGALVFDGGIYRGTLSVRRSNITIQGAGSASTIIKQPSGVVGIVLELGDTASGNGAAEYTNINVSGLTLDGGLSGAPTDDLTGWGFAATKTSYSRFSDLRILDCKSGGFGVFINSNYNTGNGIYINGTVGTAYATGQGFDMNSSKHSSYTGVVSDSDKYGVRLLDNCWNNYVQANVYNPTTSGLTLSNQTVNESHNNQVDITIEGGVTSDAVQIGANVRNCIVNATIKDSGSGGFQLINNATAAYQPSGNIVNLNTSGCNTESAKIGGLNNVVNIVSNLDGDSGAQGDYYAVTVQGNENSISLKMIDSDPWHTRTISIAAGATDNVIERWTRNDAYQLISDSGTRTKFNYSSGIGIDIASATEIGIPNKGDTFYLTGTTGITSMVLSTKGRLVTLITTDAGLVMTDGGNLRIAGNFTSTVGSTITLRCGPTYWEEVGRSLN